MAAKRCIVTGATSGIGKEIARGLLQRGAHVGIVARNPDKTADTVDELRASVPGAEIDTFIADLSELEQVRSVAKTLEASWDHVDVLVNNAGINTASAAPTAEGFDPMLVTNYLAPWLLTHLLLDSLRAGAPARVVHVASEAHRLSDKLDPDNLTDFSPSNALETQRLYGRTKLALILATQELADRVEPSVITDNAMCPGLVATNLAGDSTATRLAALASRTPLVRRPEQGASLAIRLAVDPQYEGVTGGFFSSTPGAGLLPPHPARRDRELQRRLWERTAELVGA
jgi:NAD(P)-dependent dehydrogenase (short-subunit alcohol dehydrogenase family)